MKTTQFCIIIGLMQEFNYFLSLERYDGKCDSKCKGAYELYLSCFEKISKLTSNRNNEKMTEHCGEP